MKSAWWFGLVGLTSGLVLFGGATGCGDEEKSGGGTGGALLDGASGAGGGSAGTSTAGRNPNLGAACMSDGDCGAGLQCMTDTSAAISGGSPAGGVCTAPCGSVSVAVRARVDPSVGGGVETSNRVDDETNGAVTPRPLRRRDR